MAGTMRAFVMTEVGKTAVVDKPVRHQDRREPPRGAAAGQDPAQVLLDELTVWGDAVAARAALDRWYDAGAEMPVIVLPPGRDIDDLDDVLEAMRPSGKAVT